MMEKSSDNPWTILIVDDENVIRRLLCHKLKSEGYVCIEADSPQQAMEKMHEQPVDIVILDIMMPGGSGIELLPDIKKHFPGTIVIMATAVGDADTAIKCVRLGAYDYFTKPYNLDEVVISVARALNTRRLELEIYDYQQHLEEKVQIQAAKIRDAFMNAVMALALAMDAKDEYTSGHSGRVAEISVAIAGEMGLSQSAVENIRIAGMIHDIGKIGVKEEILNKPGRLTHHEFQQIKAHSVIGERILKPIVDEQEILDIVRMHHERFDGNGYPDGLSGKQIPVGAAIMALADAYDAMTSDRPYRKSLGHAAAVDEIKKGSGIQFDPEVVEAFLRIETKTVPNTVSS
ncbi:MAG: response regulator [Dehalococcoidales bacterium]|nr:response regulator [Dehalococcoidales bacterium]